MAQDAAPAPTPAQQSAIDALITILSDDNARAALLADLEARRDGAEEPAPDTEGAAQAPEAEPEVQATPSTELRSFGGRVADWTRTAADDFVASLQSLGNELARAPRIFASLDIGALNALYAIAGDIAILIALTYGAFMLMRRITARARARLRTVFVHGGWVAKPLALMFEFVLDLVAVLVPYALGYGVAISFFGTPGDIGFEYSLYLNAFLMLEVTMAALRTIVSPTESEQRLLHLTDPEARAIMVWARILIGLFVFGQMMMLPLVNTTISFASGRAMSLVLLLVTLALAAVAVLLARKPVRNKLLRMTGNKGARKSLRGLFANWYIFALVYILVLAIVALTRTPIAFQSFIWANIQVALAVLGGAIILNVVERVLGKGIALPHSERPRNSDLERQINAVLPFILPILRFAVIVFVVLFSLARLGLWDVSGFFASGVGGRIAGSGLTIAIILAVASVTWFAVNSWIDAQIDPQRSPDATARRRTLFLLMRNALTIALVVVTLMLVLSEVGINIAPLLASAGVIGLAVGFGAQKLVQDIITGIFIQLEGAMDVGDVVSVAGISGVVERMTIRSVSLRDAEGSFHVIPFSTVAAVTNFMRGFSYAVIDVTVPYRENIADVKAAMVSAFDKLKADRDQGRFVVGTLDWNGVNTLSLADIALRARIKTQPGRQWGVKRSYNAFLKDAFQASFIGVPLAERPAVKEIEPAKDVEAKRPRKGKEEIELPDPDTGPGSSA